MHYPGPIRIPLAVEIEENIMDQLHGDRPTLYRCALVCRAWSIRCRRLLFRHIRVESQHHLDGLWNAFRKHQWLRTYVHSVAIDISDTRSCSTTILLRLIPKLPRLHSLQITGDPYEDRAFFYHPRFLGSFRGSAIETMSLTKFTFPTFAELLRFLGAFVCLRECRCNSVIVNKYNRGPDSFLERVPKQLRLHKIVLRKMNAEVAQLLLEVIKSTVRDLEVDVDGYSVMELPPMVQLRSLKFHLAGNAFSLAKSIIHTKDLLLSIQTETLHHCCIKLHKADIDNQDMMCQTDVIKAFHTLEETLLGLSSRTNPVRVVVQLTGLQPHDVAPLHTLLFQQLPRLHEQGALTLVFHDEEEPVSFSGQSSRLAVRSLRISPSGLWAAGYDLCLAALCLWRFSDGRAVLQWLTRVMDPRQVPFSPDSQHLAAAQFIGDDDPSGVEGWVVRVYDVSSGAVVQDLHDDAPAWKPIHCAWSPDQAKLAAVDQACSICVWNTHPSWQLLFRIQADVRMYVWPSLLFSHDSSSLLCWGSGWTSVIDCAAQTVHPIRTPYVSVQPSFDPQDSRLLVVDVDNCNATIVQVLDLMSHEEPVLLHAHRTEVLASCFSHDGTYVLSASVNSTVKTWDASTGIKLVSFGGNTDLPQASIAAFTPDHGRHIAFGYRDGTLRLFRVSDGECVGMSAEHKTEITNIVYSADGNTLCSGDLDGRISTHQIGHLRSLV